MTSLLLAVIYLAFISLGLPDSLLGAAWPTMSHDLSVPVSWAGGISMVISLGTIISALLSDHMTLRFGVGRVMVASVALTAAALVGFSYSTGYGMLIACAVPYGLGAGGVDAALNNYVAVHYASRHMSWLHCMWGVGVSAGPYIMSFALLHGQGWSWGYRYIAVIQCGITLLLLCSLPLWRNRRSSSTPDNEWSVDEGPAGEQSADEQSAGQRTDGQGSAVSGTRPLRLTQILAIRGAKANIAMFFCYCALETTAGLWASSYMVLHHGIDRSTAAQWAALFYIGITVGRAVGGFLTMRFDDSTMIRIGQVVLCCGVALLLLPFAASGWALAGLVLMGLGCAPIYPSIIHATPAYFGVDKSQAVVGVQMAGAYVGSLAMPPLFGLLAQEVSIAWYPWYLFILLVAMILLHGRLLHTTSAAGRRALQ